MSTLSNLIDSVTSSLHSYTGIQEQSTHLTAGIGSGDLSVPVNSVANVFKGIAEIDDEMVYIDTVGSNILTLAPYGRGYRGSLAAAHAVNAQLTSDPVYPRSEIRRAIDQCIQGIYPRLYQIKTVDLTVTPVIVGYQLPADCDGVLGVKIKIPGDPSNMWIGTARWEFDATSPEVSGKALNLMDAIPPGSSVRVVYRAGFTAFASSSSTLASVGVSESWADLILYCVTARMVRFLDPARLQVKAVENLSRSSVVQAGDAGKIANQLYAMYQQRLAEERSRLLELTPAQINYTR